MVLKGLVRVTKKARGLFHTAVKSMALWGHQAKGVPPGQLQAYRALMAKTLAIQRNGGCTTTGISLVLGPKRDPVFQVALETCQLWFDLWQHLPKSHMLIESMWAKVLPTLRNPPTRWKNVQGPISALIATLLDLGWDPLGPLNWIDFEGTEWFLDPCDPVLSTQFTQHLLRQVELHLWKRASAHHLGKGLEQGADWTVTLKKLKGYSSHELYCQHAALLIIAQGAVWEPGRVAAGSNLPPPPCEHCGQAHSWFHAVWECPHTKKMDDPRIQMTNHLCEQAKQGHEHLPCLWLRGLVPWDWTWGKTQACEVTQQFVTVGPWLALPSRWQLPRNAIAGTDGSGGEHSNDPRLRRVAWGLAVATHESFDPLALASGPVVHRQTVPRAELTALAWLIWHTHGNIDVAIDAKYVVKGYAKGPKGRHGSNADLWKDLWLAREGRDGDVRVRWTPSHVGVEELIPDIVQPWAFVMSRVTDSLAEDAAVAHQLPWHIISEIGITDARAHKIQSRLVAVLQSWLEAQPEEPRNVPTPKDKPAKVTKAATLQILVPLSRHAILDRPSTYYCSRCNMSVPKRSSELAISNWLKSECAQHELRPQPQQKGVLMHPSHQPSSYKGVHFCTVCGGWRVKSSKKLSQPCKGRAETSGSDFLKRIAKGKVPGSLKQWPVP